MRDTEDTFLTEHLHVTTSVLGKKHFINKIVKNPLGKDKTMETPCKKNNHTDKTKASSLFTSSLHILLLFKNVFICIFSASQDILKTRVLENPIEDYLL